MLNFGCNFYVGIVMSTIFLILTFVGLTINSIKLFVLAHALCCYFIGITTMIGCNQKKEKRRG